MTNKLTISQGDYCLVLLLLSSVVNVLRTFYEVPRREIYSTLPVLKKGPRLLQRCRTEKSSGKALITNRQKNNEKLNGKLSIHIDVFRSTVPNFCPQNEQNATLPTFIYVKTDRRPNNSHFCCAAAFQNVSCSLVNCVTEKTSKKGLLCYS